MRYYASMLALTTPRRAASASATLLFGDPVPDFAADIAAIATAGAGAHYGMSNASTHYGGEHARHEITEMAAYNAYMTQRALPLLFVMIGTTIAIPALWTIFSSVGQEPMLAASCFNTSLAMLCWQIRLRPALPLPAMRVDPDDSRDPWTGPLVASSARVQTIAAVGGLLIRLFLAQSVVLGSTVIPSVAFALTP